MMDFKQFNCICNSWVIKIHLMFGDRVTRYSDADRTTEHGKGWEFIKAEALASRLLNLQSVQGANQNTVGASARSEFLPFNFNSRDKARDLCVAIRITIFPYSDQTSLQSSLLIARVEGCWIGIN
jgi:hypothetical protein